MTIDDIKPEKTKDFIPLPPPPRGIRYRLKKMLGLTVAEDTQHILHIVYESLNFLLSGHFEMIQYLYDETVRLEAEVELLKHPCQPDTAQPELLNEHQSP